MTSQQARDLIPVLTAYAEGKVVQHRVIVGMAVESAHLPAWQDYALGGKHTPQLGNPTYEWRIKPTPREWWLCLCCGSRSTDNYVAKVWHCHSCRSAADVVRVQEVLP